MKLTLRRALVIQAIAILAVILLSGLTAGTAAAQGPMGGRQHGTMMGMMMGNQGNHALGASDTVTATMPCGQPAGRGCADMMSMMTQMMDKMGNSNCPAVSSGGTMTDTMSSGQAAGQGCGAMMGGGKKGDMMGMMSMMMQMMDKMGSQSSMTDTMPAGHVPSTDTMDMSAGSGVQAKGPRLTVDQARAKVGEYLSSQLDNASDLEIAEMMEFEDNFYALIEEESTGVGALELLIDPFSGSVGPEYGPNMMWNTKYGRMRESGPMGDAAMLGGMMRGLDMGGQNPREASADMPVMPEEAVQYAQQYLDRQNPGMTAETPPDKFYGYYTLHFEDKDGKMQGMLSVNGYTGRVWYHSWHGKAVDEGMAGMEM